MTEVYKNISNLMHPDSYKDFEALLDFWEKNYHKQLLTAPVENLSGYQGALQLIENLRNTRDYVEAVYLNGTS